jgi:hypothetical protein
MTKKILFVVLLLLPFASRSQVIDGQKILFYTGFSMGTSYYNGDLNPNYFPQVNFALTEPYISVFVAHYFNRFITARLNLYYAWVKGDDSYSDPDFPGTDNGYWRYNRNLRFRSSIAEVSATAEINLIPETDALGIVHRKYVPYLLVGIGAFHFNPEAPYFPGTTNSTLRPGNYVALEPLGTEGQGTPEYPDRTYYSRIAGCFPLGSGVKYNIDKQVTVALEFGIRLTTTDYLDDVSTTYVNPAYLTQLYGAGTQQAIESVYFANRNINGVNPEQSLPGQQRGDPSHLDHYVFSGISLVYRIPGITAVAPQ